MFVLVGNIPQSLFEALGVSVKDFRKYTTNCRERIYERYQDFAVYNINHEGWFQVYFVIAGVIVILWNWWVIAGYWRVRGENVEDQDVHRIRDARVTTNFDRTKYKYNYYLYYS